MLGIKAKLCDLHRLFFIEKLPFFRRIFLHDTTQYAEFGYLWRYFAGRKKGTVVDVGAHDGYSYSNSWPFLLRGWNGILVEPHLENYEKLVLLHKDLPRVQTYNFACGDQPGKFPLFFGKSDKGSAYATLSTEESPWYKATRSDRSALVNVVRLDSILAQAGCPPSFELLSIDTEGYDYQVLKGLDFNKFRPEIIITEDAEPPFSCLQEKKQLLKDNGYEQCRRCHNNGIYRALAV